MEKKNIAESQKNLFSFDIFDTLITRRCAEPCAIFAIMQHKLGNIEHMPEFIKNNFFTLRTEAEAFARFSQMIINNTTEIEFDDIYKLIQYNYLISDEIINTLKELEIQTEIDNLVPLTSNINKLKQLLKKGKSVVLISDMYHRQEILRDILCGIDPVFKDIPIYVSCEHNASKSDSKIFEIIKKEQQVQYKNWHHYGDNPKSDVQIPKQLGIKATLIKNEELMPYEKFLLKHKKDNTFFQAAAGCARLARMNKPKIVKPDVFDFGASFAAPILYNFVDWVIDFALKKKTKTLYFIARDGYIPKLIADIIIEKRNLNIKTKYLYGSRIAWRIPSDNTYDEFIDSMLLEEYSDKINIKFLSYRLGISPEVLMKLSNVSSVKKILKRKERLIFAEKFKKDKTIKTQIMELLKTKKELVKEYFKQEIDLSEKDIIFVDLHGSGKTQDHVSADLNEIADCNVYSLYLTNCLGKQKDKSKKMSYFSTANYLSFWIELLARCPQGQTTGYIKTQKGIAPVIENVNPEKLLKWGFEDYIKGIKSFCDYMLEFEQINRFSCNTPDLYCCYFTYFTKKLDPKTANIVGDIPYLAIGSEEKTSKCAPPVPLIKAAADFILCKRQKSVNEFQYISTARSGYLSRKFQKAVEKFPTLQKFCFDLHYHRRKEIAYLRIMGIKISLKRFLFKTKG